MRDAWSYKLRCCWRHRAAEPRGLQSQSIFTALLMAAQGCESYEPAVTIYVGYPGEGWSCVPATPTEGCGHLVVLPVHVSDRARVCVPAGGHMLFGVSMDAAGGAARKAATQRAVDICEELGTDACIDTVFLAGTMHANHVAVGICKQLPPACVSCDMWADLIVAEAVLGKDHPVWCTLDAIAGCEGVVEAPYQHVYMAAAAALARTHTFKGPQVEGATMLKHGAQSGGVVAPHLDLTAASGDFGGALQSAHTADSQLKAALLDAAEETGDVMLATAYIDWANRFAPVPVADMPVGLRDQVRDFGAEVDLADAPFVHRGVIPDTEALEPSVAQQPAESDFTPLSVHGILEDWAFTAIEEKLAELQVWHRARIGGRQAPRPRALALGEDAIKPAARGRIWDLRGAMEGEAPKLLDTVTPPIESHLNVDFLEELFAQCVDRELVSMLRFGVTIRVELSPQIVIMPNLLSLYDESDEGAEASASPQTPLMS